MRRGCWELSFEFLGRSNDMTRVTRLFGYRASPPPDQISPGKFTSSPAGARANAGLRKFQIRKFPRCRRGHIDSQEASDFPARPSPPPRRSRRQRRRETSAKEIFPISTALLKEIFLTRTECVMYDENDDRINTPAGVNGKISPPRVKTFYLPSLYRTGFLFGESPR